MIARGVLVGVVLIVTAACGAGSTIEAGRWELSKVADDGRALELLVEVGSGSCSRIHRVQQEETDDAVDIVVYIEHDEGMCTMDLTFERVDLVLDRPLGDRVLTGCRAADCFTATVRDG